MNANKTINAFRRKLLWEGLLRAALLALCFAGGAGLRFTLVCHLLLIKTSLTLLAVISISVFFAAFFPAFFAGYFPTKKRTARRMDELGLKERASTMLEFKDCDSTMARLQREDACAHIAALRSRQMKLRFSGRIAALSLCLLLLTAGVFALPHDLLSFGREANAETMDEEQQQIIKDLIDKLREEVEKSPLDEEIKDQIDEIVDRLEEDLKDTDSALDQAGKVEDAKNEISDLLDKELSKNSIGKALQQYEITKNTGDAVVGADPTQLKSAFADLENKINQEKDQKDELSKTINRALGESGVKAGDPLYDAFDALSSDLAALDSAKESFSEDLKQVFADAYDRIAPLLEKQKVIEEEKDKLEDILDKGKEDLLEKEDAKDQPSESEPSGEGEQSG
ncbi:MAG: hypothetical protein IJX59_05380, partial [Clostridia bacterium]|nr:hypothetical protein [Clostridia bacterium]